MFFRQILGQERVISHLRTAREKGRLSHAYLFLGPEGVGRASTARALAAALNCLTPREDGDACGACASCRRLAAGTHPDFLVIEPTPEALQKQRPQIKIGQIREFCRVTNYPPLGDGWRVVLIKPAEAMNEEAANALLKTLEEPPERHLLVLTAQAEADLLPTIVSRCHKLAFAPLPAALVARELEERRGLARAPGPAPGRPERRLPGPRPDPGPGGHSGPAPPGVGRPAGPRRRLRQRGPGLGPAPGQEPPGPG